MEQEPLFTDDIRDAVREGRYSAATAAAALEIRQAEHRRRVQAHATPAMKDRAHQALDAALSGDTEDEFSHLFDPRRPLGPAREGETSRALIYGPLGEQGKRPKPRTAASVMTDTGLFDAMFPRGYRWASGWGGDDE